MAELFLSLGYYMGADLNPQKDNLWAALLFNRPGLFRRGDTEFRTLAGLFFDRMSDRIPKAGSRNARLVRSLAAGAHPQYRREWLHARVDSFLDPTFVNPHTGPWGWKSPPTHCLAESFLSVCPNLQYVHVVRSGLDMAWSRNQRQRDLWGPILLERTPSACPRDSLVYWCAAERHVEAVAAQFSARVHRIVFEKLCADPAGQATTLLAACGLQGTSEAIEDFSSKVRQPGSIGRFRDHPTEIFEAADLAYVERCGYPTD